MEAEPQPNIELLSDQERITRIKNKPEILSINEIYDETSPSQCGYCLQKNTNFQWSLTKKKMQPYTYELMMERGWRRCGTYYYKPNLVKSCCKLFTHRLEVAKFKPKKDQKKAIKKVITIAFQPIEEIEEQTKKQGKKIEVVKKESEKSKIATTKIQQKEIPEFVKLQLQKVCFEISLKLKQSLFNLIKQGNLSQTSRGQFTFQLANKLKYFVAKKGDNADYYCNFVMLLYGLNKKLFQNPKYSLIQFAKEVKEGIQQIGTIYNFKVTVERGGYLLFNKVQNTNQFEVLQQKNQKIIQQTIIPAQQKQKKVEQISGFSKVIESIKSKLKGQSHLQARGQNELQKQIKMKDKHSSNYEVLKPNQKFKGEISITHNKITFGKITIDIVPAQQNVDSFKLYQAYTSKIHEKKQKSLSSYVNFLCLQSLQFRKQTSKITNDKKNAYVPSWDPTCKHQFPQVIEGQVVKPLGCYHMKYFFKQKLIGVGVIDLVDDGMSSVYFFYDPAFKEFRLGVFSSIIQIQYIRWMQLSFPQFRYYYMGFYISNSEKMNYKVDYMPCELLCPITYQFVQLSEEIKTKTDRIAKNQQKDIRLAQPNVEIIEDMQFKKDVGPFIDKYVKLTYDGKPLVLKQINPHFFIHILKILKANVAVWGHKLFEIFTFAI